MARNIFADITPRGTRSVFMETFRNEPQVFLQFATKVESDAPDEEHVWLGALPNPRQFLSGRNLVGIRDFTYNVVNNEYELSFIIDQNSLEDDRHNLVGRRIKDASRVWFQYQDQLFADLLNNGQTDNSYDGVSFFNNSH
ncbi:hypothetical protein LCGC14_2961300, partial [marine sediment metagenome]